MAASSFTILNPFPGSLGKAIAHEPELTATRQRFLSQKPTPTLPVHPEYKAASEALLQMESAALNLKKLAGDVKGPAVVAEEFNLRGCAKAGDEALAHARLNTHSVKTRSDNVFWCNEDAKLVAEFFHDKGSAATVQDFVLRKDEAIKQLVSGAVAWRNAAQALALELGDETIQQGRLGSESLRKLIQRGDSLAEFAHLMTAKASQLVESMAAHVSHDSPLNKAQGDLVRARIKNDIQSVDTAARPSHLLRRAVAHVGRVWENRQIATEKIGGFFSSTKVNLRETSEGFKISISRSKFSLPFSKAAAVPVVEVTLNTANEDVAIKKLSEISAFLRSNKSGFSSDGISAELLSSVAADGEISRIENLALKGNLLGIDFDRTVFKNAETSNCIISIRREAKLANSDKNLPTNIDKHETEAEQFHFGEGTPYSAIVNGTGADLDVGEALLTAPGLDGEVKRKGISHYVLGIDGGKIEVSKVSPSETKVDVYQKIDGEYSLIEDASGTFKSSEALAYILEIRRRNPLPAPSDTIIGSRLAEKRESFSLARQVGNGLIWLLRH